MAIFALVMLVPAVVFLENLGIFGAWILFWICCVALSLFAPQSRTAQGFGILTFSLLIAVFGLAYSKKFYPADLWIVEVFSQLMILAGSGVGSNFMAAGLLGWDR